MCFAVLGWGKPIFEILPAIIALGIIGSFAGAVAVAVFMPSELVNYGLLPIRKDDSD